MTIELQKTSYKNFCVFAWEHLKKLPELDKPPLKRRFPISEFAEGCAYIALAQYSCEEQRENFGFTLSEVREGHFGHHLAVYLSGLSKSNDSRAAV